MKIGFLGAMKSQNSKSWVDALRRQGHEVHIWSMGSHEKDELPTWKDIISELRRLRTWLKHLKPDLVIAYRTTSYGFLAALSGFQPYVTAAQGETDAWPPGGISGMLKNLLGSIALTRAAKVHAWSENMLWGLEKMGLNKKKLILKPRGIDLTHFAFTPADIHSSTIRIAVTRSLFPEYHVDKIIEAFALWYAESGTYKKVELHIAGDGPLKKILMNKALELNIAESVFFHGHLPYTELRELLSTVHIYCSMPETDGASTSLFEAFAIGIYPIVTDLSANRLWIKNRVNGMLVKQGDVKALTCAFDEAIAQLEDFPAILKKNRSMAEEELSIEKNMAFFTEQYSQIIRKQNR